MRDEFGMYDKESDTAFSRGALHLGKKGLRLLAISIKLCVMGKYKRQGQGQQGTTAEQGYHDGYQSTWYLSYLNSKCLGYKKKLFGLTTKL